MKKEMIESLIWQVFNGKLTNKRIPLNYRDALEIPGRDIVLKFMTTSEHIFRTGCNHRNSWGILMTNWEKDKYGFPISKDENGYYNGSPDKKTFPIYWYFEGKSADIQKNADQIVSAMADDIMMFIGE